MLSFGILMLAAGCAAKSSGSGSGQPDGADTCDLAALGLGSARNVPAWTPPVACKQSDGAGAAGIVRTEEGFRARFICANGASSGIDFQQNQLVVQVRTLSPAGVGGEIADDGKTVTYVSHFRRNCPDEPRPMPMGYTVMFLLPAGADRQFADASCTVGAQPSCH